MKRSGRQLMADGRWPALLKRAPRLVAPAFQPVSSKPPAAQLARSTRYEGTACKAVPRETGGEQKKTEPACGGPGLHPSVGPLLQDCAGHAAAAIQERMSNFNH